MHIVTAKKRLKLRQAEHAWSRHTSSVNVKMAGNGPSPFPLPFPTSA